MARLFFAVQPDAKAREAIAAIARDVARRHGGRPTPAPRIHLTLAFLGDVEEERVAVARSAAQATAARTFELSLDRIGSFARQSLAWVGPGTIPEGLAMLQRDLAGRLGEAGFVLERRAFSPHITVARRIERPLAPAAIVAIAWTVTGFVLVQSDLATGTYRDLEHRALGAPVKEKRTS